MFEFETQTCNEIFENVTKKHNFCRFFVFSPGQPGHLCPPYAEPLLLRFGQYSAEILHPVGLHHREGGLGGEGHGKSGKSSGKDCTRIFICFAHVYSFVLSRIISIMN